VPLREWFRELEDADRGLYQPGWWPGNWGGRGPDSATTGVIRPASEVAGRVVIAVHDFTVTGSHIWLRKL